MQNIRWNLLKSERLKKTRGVSFEDILHGKLVAVKKNPARKDQNIMLFEYKRYIWIVPFIIEENGDLFLKTLFPSRKYTKMFREEKL